jgi:hypothetical protein
LAVKRTNIRFTVILNFTWNKLIVVATSSPLWYSGQRFWLQIQRSGFDSRTFWEVVGLEQGPLSLVSTTEELLWRKSRDSGLEIREYSCRDPSCLTTWHPLSEKVGANFANKWRSLGIVRSRTQATEFGF